MHGFPSSSREFDTLIPLLAVRYHLIAPDFPSFSRAIRRRRRLTVTPSIIWRRRPTYCSINSRYRVIRSAFTNTGAPVGFRIAVAHPERVQALIIQNGNAYKEGRLKWAKIAKYWADPVAMRASQPTIDVSPLSECLAQQFARSAISFDFAGLLVRFFRASASITDKLS